MDVGALTFDQAPSRVERLAELMTDSVEEEYARNPHKYRPHRVQEAAVDS